EVERHSLPPPIIDQETKSGKRFGGGSGRYSGLLAISPDAHSPRPTNAVLPAHGTLGHLVGPNRAHRMKDVYFLVADLIGTKRHHGLHGDQAKKLHEMVLHHVP